MIEELISCQCSGVCHLAHRCQQSSEKFADTASLYKGCEATRFQSNSNSPSTAIKYERRPVEGSRLIGIAWAKICELRDFLFLQKKGLYVLADRVQKYYEANATNNPSKTVPKVGNTRTFIAFPFVFRPLCKVLIF